MVSRDLDPKHRSSNTCQCSDHTEQAKVTARYTEGLSLHGDTEECTGHGWRWGEGGTLHGKPQEGEPRADGCSRSTGQTRKEGKSGGNASLSSLLFHLK